MRYLLVVEFACDLYCREPLAEVFLNNQLIDVFHISHAPDKLSKSIDKFLNTLHPLQPNIKLQNVKIKNFNKLKFYEVEIDEKIKHTTLQISIKNSDSNYSNGFITRSTFIKLKTFYFFPLNKKVLLRFKKIKDKNRISQNYAWYKTDKNFIFDLVQNGVSWKGANGQKIQKVKSSSDFSKVTIGGNGKFICYLIKKYGIFVPTLARSCRYRFDWDLTNFFIDKYFEYANQRNIN